jgi:IclR family acetate operon transcriptional repressor
MSAAQATRSARLSSVGNAARLLRQFSRTDRELGVSEIARRLGVTTSTAFRLLATLTDEGLLERGQAPGSYRLGLAMYELGVTVIPNLDLHEAALPVLAALRQRTGETVQMGVLDHLEVVYIERLESPQTLRIFDRTGHRVPAHATSTGKILLAHLPAEVLHERLEEWQPVRLTPHTLVERGALLADLRRVVERGWAQNIEEGSLGAVSVGAPIRDEHGSVIAALSLVAPAFRVDQQALNRYRDLVVDGAHTVSRRIGYAHATLAAGPLIRRATS